MSYSRNDILVKCNAAFKDIKTFYKQSFINYNGKTVDTNEYYTEVVAEFLCNNLKEFIDGIPQITRKKSYKTPTHNGEFNQETPREEEKIAMEMFNQSQQGLQYDFIGSILDYQTPLKNSKDDKAGKIDLLSYNGKTLHVLELKKPDSDESMLRCVLEGFTYMETMDREKILKDFELPSNIDVKASPFVFKDGTQHRQMIEERPHLFKLMMLLESTPYYINRENGVYKVEGQK